MAKADRPVSTLTTSRQDEAHLDGQGQTDAVNFDNEQDEAHHDGHATAFTPRPNRTKPAQTTTTNPGGVNFDSQQDEAHHEGQPDGVNFDNQRAKPAPTPNGSKPARRELRRNGLRRSSGSKRKKKSGQLTSSAIRTLYLGSAGRRELARGRGETKANEGIRAGGLWGERRESRAAV